MEQKYKILIVDDEQSITDMLKLQLEFENYMVYTARNAEEALEKLSHCPDLILLDINMAGMNGIDLCISIREFVTCPILFLTARVSEQDKINGLMVGGDAAKRKADFRKNSLSITQTEAFISKGIPWNCQTKNLKSSNCCQ